MDYSILFGVLIIYFFIFGIFFTIEYVAVKVVAKEFNVSEKEVRINSYKGE